MLTLNKWQRLVVSLAACICLGRAAYLFVQSDSAGSAFIAGTIFAIVALLPSAPSESLLPDPRPWLTKHWRRLLASMVVVAIGVVALVVGAVIIQSRQQAKASARLEKEHQEWEREQASRLEHAKAEYASCMKQASTKDGASKDGASRILDRMLDKARCKAALEHRAEKWEPVFRKKRCDNKYIERAV